MPQVELSANVRSAGDVANVIDIQGELTSMAETVLMDAYAQASGEGNQAIILNFSDMDYMNSSGIGLLVRLLIRAKRQGQQFLACGLSEHDQNIFQWTGLSEAVRIFDTEAEALAALV